MENRSYFRSSIAELEKLFASSTDNVPVLKALYNELGHRNTFRALELHEKIKKMLTKSTASERDRELPKQDPIRSGNGDDEMQVPAPRSPDEINEMPFDPKQSISSSPSPDVTASDSQYKPVDVENRVTKATAVPN